MITHHRRYKCHGRSYPMAMHLVEKGHKVSLIVIANHRQFGVVESEENGVHFVESPDLFWGRLRSGWDPWDTLNRIRYLKSENGSYDLVHCFETRPASIYPAMFYCRRHKIPLVTDWNDWWGRGGIIDELRPKWYCLLFGAVETYYEEAFRTRAAGLTTISTALVERAKGLGVQAQRICYLPEGIYPDFFQYRTKEDCRERVGLSPSDPVLGFSSFDSHWDLKTKTFMQALKIVAKRYPKVKLLITGEAGKSTKDMARNHGVEANVHLTGWLPRPDLPWWLGCADMFLLPFPDKIYNSGRWPNKIGDYMSLGRPTVSNPVGDIKSLFEKYDIGRLAMWEPDDLAENIIYLLENPEVAHRLGENARQTALDCDWRVLIRRLEEFYNKVLSLGVHDTGRPCC